MIDLHYWTSPNGHKVTMFLEETRLPYWLVPIDITKNAQFEGEFLKISPNNKIPAIVDRAPLGDGEPPSIFESGAILVYLAKKKPGSCCHKTREVKAMHCNGPSGRSRD
jgi:GST-like protein